MKLLSKTYLANNYSFSPLDYKGVINIKGKIFKCPIDNYINHTEQINRAFYVNNKATQHLKFLFDQGRIDDVVLAELKNIILDPNNINKTVLNLSLLGHISAVESYMREIVTKIINIDQQSYNKCINKSITFLAANSHTKETLPESLLENSNFISYNEIKNLLNDYIDLNLDQIKLNSSIKDLMHEYEKICQIRNAIIHRFSKIGIKNLEKLDLHSDTNLLEKKIEVDWVFIQRVTDICFNLVMELNNLLAENIILRNIVDLKTIKKKQESNFQMIWESDKGVFITYYKLFYSKTLGNHVKSEYNKFVKIYNNAK